MKLLGERKKRKKRKEEQKGMGRVDFHEIKSEIFFTAADREKNSCLEALFPVYFIFSLFTFEPY